MFIFDGIFVNAATVLTGGVFLSGYIVLLNGSDFLVGLLNNSGTWASILAIFSYLIFERMERRKHLLLILNVVSRVLICGSALLPLIFKNSRFILPAVTAMVIIGNVIWSFYSIGITVMMINLLSRESRSNYIYFRMFWLRISFTITTISMGIVLDMFNKSYTGFLVVYMISLLFSIADAIVLSGVNEPFNAVNKEMKFEASKFFEPVRNKKYRNFLLFIFFFYFTLTMSSSYTNLYLIRYMKFDYSFISTILVISYILMIVCTNFWNRVERKKGLKFVMGITSIFAVSEFLVYSFLTSRTYYLLFFAPILSGTGNSGFNVTLMTRRYELIPEKSKTIYEGWFGAVYGLSVLVSPVAGSMIMKVLPVIHNSIYQYSSFQLMYLISFFSALIVVYFEFFKPEKKLPNESSAV